MTTREQNSTKRIAIFIESNFQDTEFLVPYTGLRQAGADVVVLGSRKHVAYAGEQGRTSITSDATTTEKLPDAFDAVIIPGGTAPDIMRTDMKTVHFVQRAIQQGKLVAAIGHGPQVLVEGDLLRGRRATGFRSIRKDMQNAGASYAHEPVVIDDNLITSRRPGDLPILVTALLHRLGLTIQGISLPDENDRHAEWWKLAEAWGGSSKAEIVAALSEALASEKYALDMCRQHAQKASDEALRAAFQAVCTDAEHHIQLLTARLSELGAAASPPFADGAAAAVKDWSQSHDSMMVLLDVLDHLQARIVAIYRLCNTTTDPAATDIFDQIEVDLARSEQHLADLYHQRHTGTERSVERNDAVS